MKPYSDAFIFFTKEQLSFNSNTFLFTTYILYAVNLHDVDDDEMTDLAHKLDTWTFLKSLNVSCYYTEVCREKTIFWGRMQASG